MARSRGPGVLRWLAALLVRGPDAHFIRAELDDAMERDLVRGISLWRARRRYLSNVLGSAFSVWRERLRWPEFGVSMLDVKLGLRMLRKQPGLTIVALLALAVGIPIGLAPAHAAHALATPPSVEHGERIQILKHYDVANSRWTTTSLYDFDVWQEALSSFQSLGATTRGVAHNVGVEEGRAAPVRGAEVSASTFAVLREGALLGRTLTSADEVVGAPPVVVISFDLWNSRLAGDPAVLGRALRIDGVMHEIVGVMAEDFHFPIDDQLWLPIRATVTTDDHAGQEYTVFGRLADGVTVEDAAAELTTIGGRMAVDLPEIHGRLRPEVVAFTTGLYGFPKGGLSGMIEFYFFQVLALLVLVVACVNIGMLFLARTASRSGEVVVRTALGASRSRVVLQLFTESLVLAVLAAGIGLLAADIVANRAFGWLMNAMPTWVDLGVTPRTTLQAMGLAVFSAAIVGVIPALKVTGKSVQQNIQRTAASRAGVRFGGLSSALIIADVTLAVATLALAIASSDLFVNAQTDTAVAEQRYLATSVLVPWDETHRETGDFDGEAFLAKVGATQQELVRRLSEQPDVRAVTFGDALPGMIHRTAEVEVDGEQTAEEFRGHHIRLAHVDIGFFDAFEQPVLSGRGFTTSDLVGDVPVVIVNTSFVENVLGGRNPIGRRIRYLAPPGQEPGPWHEIVGLVDHLGMLAMRPDRDQGIYHPMAPGQAALAARLAGGMSGRYHIRLATRTDSDPASFTPRLREIANGIDASIIIAGSQRLDEVFNIDTYSMRWVRVGAFALVAILLGMSTSGTYALMAFTVSQRTREIGIRTALGERPGSLAMTIARRALAQLGLGVALGMLIAGFLLADLNSEAHHSAFHLILLTLLVGAGVLLVTGLSACVAPTLRALRIMPTEALRNGG